MSAASEKTRKRRIRLVGGGYRWSRQMDGGTKGGSLKSQRRGLRQNMKAQKKRGELTPEGRRAIKKMLADMLARKDGR